MTEPKLHKGLFCAKCGRTETVSLVENLSQVTWCSCGHIKVIVTIGQEVLVVRG